MQFLAGGLFFPHHPSLPFDMSEISRKRPHTDDGDVTVAKKRVLTGTNGTPQVNGHSDQTEDEQICQANLEKFRKEAIYRRMKHYYRENERNLVRIQELERRKTTCEAGLAAMTACWSQLIETIRVFVKTDDMTPDSIRGRDVFDVAAHVDEESLPELREALGKTATATGALVNRLIQSGGPEQPLVFKQSYLEDLQQSQTECAALRSQLDVLKKQLEDCVSEKERYHDELVAAENRAERAKSTTIDLVHKHKEKPAAPKDGESATEDTERKPPSPSQVHSQSPTPATDRTTPSESVPPLLPESVKRWEDRIKELEDERNELQKKLMEVPAEHRVISGPDPSKSLEQLNKANASLKSDLSRAQEELKNLYQYRNDWQQGVLAESTRFIENAKAMMIKRDAENTRLREQRDQHFAELVERRQRDERKWAALQEYKDLSENQAERIAVLQSELARCKARLSANERQGDLLQFFLQGNPEEAHLVLELRRQKEDAEMRVQAAETALSQLGGAEQPPDYEALVKARVDAEERVVRLSRELEALRQVFGEESLNPLPPDVAQLNAQIRRQAEELQRLRLLTTSLESAEAELFKELEKLSTAWETLEGQVKSKVFDLYQMEEKVSKAVIDKARSENKYFATMREKEALDAEKKALVRVQEKSEKALMDTIARVDGLEKQVRAAQDELLAESKLKSSALAKVDEITTFAFSLQQQLQATDNKCHNHMANYTQALKAVSQESAALRQKGAEWDRQKSRLEDQIHRLKQELATKHALQKGGSDTEVFNNMRTLLYCSTCTNNIRNVVITKCMHSFCKECIDARIATRQRKCPACTTPFGQGDVQTYYMQ